MRNLLRHNARSLIFRKLLTSFTEVKDSLHGSNASLTDEMEVQGASSSASLTVTNDSKTPPKKQNSAPDSSKSPKRNYNILIDPAFSISIVML